jgi:Protein of unknown function (DUF4238)
VVSFGSGTEKLRRRNHTVQKALLCRFASKKGRLISVSLDGITHPVNANDATVIKDFYNTRRADGSIDDSFERSPELHRVEDRLSALLKRIIGEQEWPIRPNDRAALARWIGLQMVRTPATRSFPGDLKDTILRVELDLWRPADLGRYFVGRGRHIAEELWEELWEIYMDKRGATSDVMPSFISG